MNEALIHAFEIKVLTTSLINQVPGRFGQQSQAMTWLNCGSKQFFYAVTNNHFYSKCLCIRDVSCV